MSITVKAKSHERLVLVGMITNKQVLSAVTKAWRGEGLFASRYANLVGKWCVEYYQRYNRPPNKEIEPLFEDWAAATDKPQTARLVERILRQASKEYDQGKSQNAEFILDKASEHFKMIHLANISKEVGRAIENSDLTVAEKLMSSYDSVQIADRGFINLGSISKDKLEDALDMSKRQPLIKYPQALKFFFGTALERDAFVALMAPEKRGKTWWMIDMAVRASLQKKRVAFFEAGDMSERQLLRRFVIRTSKRPLSAKTVNIPTELERVDDKTIEATHRTETFEDEINLTAAMKRLARMKDLRISCHPNSTLTTAEIRSTLDHWECSEGWLPDVIVIDYADILAHPKHFEGRDAVNENWKQLRRISQERHCLVITATQADAASYSKDNLDMSNFSEDKRKFAHVTGMFGLNANQKEKQKRQQRLNWIVLREAEFDLTKHCHVAACLDIGQVAVCSTF